MNQQSELKPATAAMSSKNAVHDGNYFPRTINGWCTLFWLTLRICPKCKGRLLSDPWAWAAEDIVYCMQCGGAMLPRGFIRALLFNKRATSRDGLVSRANKLPRDGWFVGRTDLHSYDGKTGRLEHYAYGPNNAERRWFGEGALLNAVEYAEKMNLKTITEKVKS